MPGCIYLFPFIYMNAGQVERVTQKFGALKDSSAFHLAIFHSTWFVCLFVSQNPYTTLFLKNLIMVYKEQQGLKGGIQKCAG